MNVQEWCDTLIGQPYYTSDALNNKTKRFAMARKLKELSATNPDAAEGFRQVYTRLEADLPDYHGNPPNPVSHVYDMDKAAARVVKIAEDRNMQAEVAAARRNGTVPEFVEELRSRGLLTGVPTDAGYRSYKTLQSRS